MRFSFFARGGPWLIAFGVLAVCIGHAGDAMANFPPFAKASASPDEVLVGEIVTLSAVGSIDPDDGPQPLSFEWDFGFTTRQGEVVTQSFSEPGAFPVTLTVSDGEATTLKTLVVVVLSPPASGTPTRSKPLAWVREQSELWVVNPDSGTVSILDSQGDNKLEEVEICTAPRTLAADDAGKLVYVVCQGSSELVAIDVAERTVVARLPVGRQPYGVAIMAGDGRLLVSSQDDATVYVVSPGEEPSIEAAIPVAAMPRALAIAADGRRAYVTHFLTTGDTGTVSVIDLQTLEVLETIALQENPGPDTASSGRGFPNLLSAAAVDPSGSLLWIGGLKSNTSAGLFREGTPIDPRNWVRGLLAPVALAETSDLVARRIDTNDADSVSGIAFSPRGRFAYVTHQGAGTLSVYDLSLAAQIDPSDGASVGAVSRVDVGVAPQGVVVNAAGTRAFVTNFMSRDVTVIDIEDPTDAVVLSTISVTQEVLEPSIANGKRLFYTSKEPRHSKSNYIACASCHADGGMHDGRTWDTTQNGEGLRNTKDLRGRGGVQDGPVHWSANFDEIQDFERDIVETFGGTGLADDGAPPNPPLGASNAGRSADLDDLAAYVTSLAGAPPSPHRLPDGGLTEAAERGLAVYLAIGCDDCHALPRYTDSDLDIDVADWPLYDIGTLTDASGQRLGDLLIGIDTPSLVGAWASAPYFHDGSAATLREVLTRDPDAVKGELVATLSATELDDLIAYVSSIDAVDVPPPPAAAPPPGSCACRQGATHETDDAWVSLLILLAACMGCARRFETKHLKDLRR